MSTKNKLPGHKKSFHQDRFRWTSRGGITVDLPALATLSLNELEALQNAKDASAITSIADTAEGKEAMRSLPLRELSGMIRAWTNDGKAALGGKSGASSTS